MKSCEKCQSPLSGKQKRFCSKCDSSKFEITCPECDKKRKVTVAYFLKTSGISLCASCTRLGERSKERIAKKLVTEKLKKDSGYKKVFSDETRKNIGLASSKRYTVEYKQKIRKNYENRGIWQKLSEKEDYSFYCKIADWKYQVLTEHTVGIEKLKTEKLYSKTRNKFDLVRDHMFSRRLGFKLGVFPEILRHPANCQLISHVENFNKGKRREDSIISMEELFKRIHEWPIFYEEQPTCLELISKYLEGQRYDRANYEINFYAH